MADDAKVKQGVDEATVAAARALESDKYDAGFETEIE